MRPEAAKELATKDRLLNIRVFSSLAFLSIKCRVAMAASEALVDTQPPILLRLQRKNNADSAPVQALTLLAGGPRRKHCMQ